jgi:hypothetical protein
MYSVVSICIMESCHIWTSIFTSNCPICAPFLWGTSPPPLFFHVLSPSYLSHPINPSPSESANTGIQCIPLSTPMNHNLYLLSNGPRPFLVLLPSYILPKIAPSVMLSRAPWLKKFRFKQPSYQSIMKGILVNSSWVAIMNGTWVLQLISLM